MNIFTTIGYFTVTLIILFSIFCTVEYLVYFPRRKELEKRIVSYQKQLEEYRFYIEKLEELRDIQKEIIEKRAALLKEFQNRDE